MKLMLFGKTGEYFQTPVKGQLTIEFRAEQTGIALGEIIDYTGRTVYKKTFKINFGYNQRQIKLPALSSGIHFLRVNSGNLIKTEPILVR